MRSTAGAGLIVIRPRLRGQAVPWGTSEWEKVSATPEDPVRGSKSNKTALTKLTESPFRLV